MTVTGDMPTSGDGPEDWPDIPTSAWALAWSFLAGQVLELARRGPQDESSWPLSILLGVAAVVFVSHGVMRVRWVRFWLVAALLVAGAVIALFDVVNQPTAGGAAGLALSVLQLGLLHQYSRTEWWAWQVARRPGSPSLSGILVLAAVVGALGGVLGSSSDGFSAHVDIG